MAKKSTKARKGTKANDRKPATTDAQVAKFDKELAGPALARPGSKLELIINMMKAKGGTTLADMAKATKWAPAAVRGVIYNAVRGRLGMTVTLTPNEDRGTVFNIVAAK